MRKSPMLNDCARCEIIWREADPDYIRTDGADFRTKWRVRWPHMRRYLRHLRRDHDRAG